MTLIVGAALDGQVVIGGDAFIGGPWFSNELGYPKVLTIRAEDGRKAILGLAGKPGGLWVLQAPDFRMPPHPPDVDDRHYCGSILGPVLLTAIGGLKTDSDDSSCLVVGYRGRIYHLDATGTMQSYATNRAATGAAIEIAAGSMATASALGVTDPMTLCRLAMEAGEAHSPCVRRPFTYLVLEAD